MNEKKNIPVGREIVELKDIDILEKWNEHWNEHIKTA